MIESFATVAGLVLFLVFLFAGLWIPSQSRRPGSS